MPTNILLTDSTSANSVSSLSLPTANIGLPDPDRQVLIAVTSVGAGIQGATLNGATAAFEISTGTVNASAAILSIPIAAGTSANIVATLTGVATFASMGIFNLQDGSVGAVSNASTNLTGVSSISLSTVTIPVNGAGLFLVSSSGTSGINWTNVTSQYDLILAGEGSAGETSLAGTPTVTATNVLGTSNLGIVGSAWSFFTSAHAFLPFRNVSNVRFL